MRVMGNGTPYVHVVVYNDSPGGYVWLDVFATFDAALRQFDRRLRETRQDLGSDAIECVERNPAEHQLHFRDETGYEVFYRRESIQD